MVLIAWFNLTSYLKSEIVIALTSVCIQRSAKRRGCLLSYSQAEPGRELTQPIPRLLAEPCIASNSKLMASEAMVASEIKLGIIFVISNLNYPEIYVHVSPNSHIGGL